MSTIDAICDLRRPLPSSRTVASVTIRPATADDRAWLHALACAAFLGTPDFHGFTGRELAPAADAFLDVFYRPANRSALATSFVAILPSSDQVVGAALAQHAQAGGVLLDMIAVRPDHQAAGIATALFGFLAREEKKRATAFLRSRVYLENAASVAWHRRVGFEIGGEPFKDPRSPS